MKAKFKITFLILALFLISCKDSKKPNFEYAPDMAHYLPYPSYSENPKLPLGRSALTPVEGTVPRGHKPFPYPNDIDGFERAGRELKNPFASTQSVLAEGKRLYDIYCSVCHGEAGRGDGPVTKSEQFPKLTTMDLASEVVKNLSEGQIYFVITHGFGLMNSYGGVLTPEERWKIVSYVRYLQNLSESQPVQRDTLSKPKISASLDFYPGGKVGNRDMIIIAIAFLLVTAVITLLRKNYLALIFLTLIPVVIYLGVQFFNYFASFGRQEGYQPEQPIIFSHKVHAGEYKINCLYCHFAAEKGPVAGVPSVETCMNCHKFITEGKNTGEVEIKKIFEAFSNSEPIRWTKVNFLPAHVRFSHAQHVKVGKIDCQRCHGPVEQMDVMKQFYSLSMGWCIDCHRKASIDLSNRYYGIKANQKITVVDVNKLDCQTCHY